jgi:predicted transcriptional regulator
MSTLSELLAKKGLWRAQTLGPLETQVLEVLMDKGECSVRDVLNAMSRPLAYTTVMTTLDRLFKKGLLERHMSDRSFRYVPCEPRFQMANSSRFSLNSPNARALLVSHLLDTVCEYDKTLLEELERNIAERRRQYEAEFADVTEVQP